MNRYFDAYAGGAPGGGMLTLPPPPLSEPDATWNSYASAPAGRIKPDRSRHAAVQKLQWRRSNWVDGFPEMVSSMTIADVSPRFAVKRILIMYENAQYREAANFINRLSHTTFKAILSELPIDVFVEAMPHSVSILEALYGKVFLSSDLCVKVLRPENVLMRLVKLFSGSPGCADRWLASTRKLVKVIVLSEPKLRKTLMLRRRALDKAVEGLGQHGLVGTSDQNLTNLHDALKVEFQNLIDTYKSAVQKLEELSLSVSGKGKDTISKGPAPIQASHQRQLSLKQNDVQERLIKNKTLLNVVEPALQNKSLAILLTILKRRVEHDKDALFQFTQLRKELEADSDHVVAPLLMRYSLACQQVLELMKEVSEEEDSSDISGYHSDSDSAIMMSGNSPYVTKRARHNFLNRSVRSSSNCSARTRLVTSTASSSESPPENDHHSTTDSRDWDWNTDKSRLSVLCENCGPRNGITYGSPTRQEIVALQAELETTKAELERAKIRMETLNRTIQLNSPATKELGAQRLVRCYGNLYSQARVDALEALDSIPQLHGATELKSKILFSIVVLAFRAAEGLLAQKKDHMRQLMFAGNNSVTVCQQELEAAVCTYLRRTVDTFDITHCIQEVTAQLWATLYDYPCLKTCPGLLQYIKDSVRLAWALSNQIVAYVLEYELRIFKREMHVRFHTSNNESEQIRTYLWPALLEGPSGPCVHKAVVIT